MARKPKAGWHPDPATPGRERYWDGRQWTGDGRDAPPPKRRRRGSTVLKVMLGVVLGVVVLIAGCAALVGVGLNSKNEDGITRAQFDGVSQGSTQEDIEADLGDPEDSQEFEQNIPELEQGTSRSSCIYYSEKGKKILEGSSFQLCFDDGKLSSKNVY